MNISKILTLGVVAALSLSSCSNEDFPEEKNGKGTMSLTVDKLAPTKKDNVANTRAVDTSVFPVSIYSSADNSQFASYETVTAVPNKITMPVGTYYAVAHTPGNLDKLMDEPYYKGTETFNILQGVNTQCNVVCRMANGSVTVRFSDDFAMAFRSWTVTIDDGSESAIVYTYDRDGATPPTKYILFEENTKALSVNFVGTTFNGNRITASNKLTKQQASEQYEDDNEFFSGGDACVITFSAVEGTEGDISGVNVTANISFDESEENFEMEVEDKETTPGGGEDNPGGNEGDDDAISLVLPPNMTVDTTTDPSLGDANISCANGIKSISVKVESTSEEMVSSLQALSAEYDGVDFLAGAEVVGNSEMVKLFSSLGQNLEVPSEGDAEYTFPVGNFFVFLSMMPGDHSFVLTVTDMQGNKKDGRLTITIK